MSHIKHDTYLFIKFRSFKLKFFTSEVVGKLYRKVRQSEYVPKINIVYQK